MALKIIWTSQAVEGLETLINYLDTYWTAKEILQLEQNLQAFLERISNYPEMYPATKKHKHIRKGLIDRNNYIVYKINPEEKTIQLINFRGTKQKPLK